MDAMDTMTYHHNVFGTPSLKKDEAHFRVFDQGRQDQQISGLILRVWLALCACVGTLQQPDPVSASWITGPLWYLPALIADQRAQIQNVHLCSSWTREGRDSSRHEQARRT